MFTNVIVGVDGFDGGRDAVALARALCDGRLTLVGVHPEDRFRTRASTEGYWRAQHEDAERALRAAREEGAVPAAEILAIGDRSPARALHRAAEDLGADLLVLGSAHHGPLGRLLAGDVDRDVLHGAPCPVAIAPKRYRGRLAGGIGGVSVAVDGSPESRAALELAARLAAEHEVRLRILVVWEQPSRMIAVGTATATELVGLEEEHRARAQELLDRAVAAHPGAEGRLLEGSPGPALEAAAAHTNLLVVGSRGWGPARRLASGSTSDWLVRHAWCAVLVVPRPAEGATEEAGDVPAARTTASWPSPMSARPPHAGSSGHRP